MSARAFQHSSAGRAIGSFAMIPEWLIRWEDRSFDRSPYFLELKKDAAILEKCCENVGTVTVSAVCSFSPESAEVVEDIASGPFLALCNCEVLGLAFFVGISPTFMDEPAVLHRYRHDTIGFRGILS